MSDNPDVRCADCDWEGYSEELVALTDDLDDRDFSHCPYCESSNIESTDHDEEED